MGGLRTLGLAGCVALCGAGSVLAETAPLLLAQGFDINDLLKGGTPPEVTAPDLPMRGLPMRGLPMRGLPAPPEAELATSIAPLPPVAAFPASALVGLWNGVGAACPDRLLEFRPSGDRFIGESTWRDPVDGYRITTLFDAAPGAALPGAAHPDDPARFFSYAQQYSARVTRRDGSGAVVDLVEEIAVTLLVTRDDDQLSLRIVEPVTDCHYARPADPSN